MPKLLYTYPLRFARERNEIDVYTGSRDENIACKNAIEGMIRANFDGSHLHGECAKELCEKYGMERVGWVLANTVQHYTWDARFRPHTQQWAGKFPIPTAAEDMTTDYCVSSHPEIVNGLIDQYRSYVQSVDVLNSSEKEDLQEPGSIGESDNGMEMDGNKEHAMRIKVYQIDDKLDRYNTAFQSYESVLNTAGRVDPSIYKTVYDGKVETDNLEAIYTICNTDHPVGYNGHSLSVGDVVELEDGSCHFCDSFGFQELKDFDASKAAPIIGHRMLVIEPHKAPYEMVIPDGLDALQQAVRGYIECTYPFDDNAFIIGNV